MKNALIVEGPGFADPIEMTRQLELCGYRVILRRAGSEKGSAPMPEIKSADLILLRGPWSATPEESIWARVLADRLREELLPALDPKNPKGPLVLGCGRGALILWMLCGLEDKGDWREAFRAAGPWLDSRFAADPNFSFPSLVQGRALPRPAAGLEYLSPWLTADQENAGWRWGKRVFASFPDLFAYAERSQLGDFGYADLLEVPTQGMILEKFLTCYDDAPPRPREPATRENV